MPRPDVSDERIPQILSAATQMFAQYGVDGASMNQIAEASGLSKAAVYHYFASKDDLIKALVHRLFDSDMPQVMQMLEAEDRVEVRLRQYVTNLARLLERERQLLTLVTELRSRASRVPELHTIVSSFFAHYVDAFAAVLRQGVASSELVDMDVMRTARAITALIEGSIVLATTLDDSLEEVMLANLDVFLSPRTR